MSFQVLLRRFSVFKCTDQNFAGWLVTSKRNPTERVAPSPRPCPPIASGRLETKYSFPDFSPKITAREIHETSMATSHTSRYSDLSFFFFVFIRQFTSVSLVFILFQHCNRFGLYSAWSLILSDRRSFDSTRVLSSDTGFRFGLFLFSIISNADRSDAVGYEPHPFNFYLSAFQLLKRKSIIYGKLYRALL